MLDPYLLLILGQLLHLIHLEVMTEQKYKDFIDYRRFVISENETLLDSTITLASSMPVDAINLWKNDETKKRDLELKKLVTGERKQLVQPEL